MFLISQGFYIFLCLGPTVLSWLFIIWLVSSIKGLKQRVGKLEGQVRMHQAQVSRPQPTTPYKRPSLGPSAPTKSTKPKPDWLDE